MCTSRLIYADASAHAGICFQVPALGWRKRDVNGNLGAYTWLTYSQVRAAHQTRRGKAAGLHGTCSLLTACSVSSSSSDILLVSP
jgi:hypothetical protein